MSRDSGTLDDPAYCGVFYGVLIHSCESKGHVEYHHSGSGEAHHIFLTAYDNENHDDLSDVVTEDDDDHFECMSSSSIVITGDMIVAVFVMIVIIPSMEGMIITVCI